MKCSHIAAAVLGAGLLALVSPIAALAEDGAASQVAARTQARTLVVGTISKNPKKQFPMLEAMANYLARELRDLGYDGGAAIVARDNIEMVQLMREGAVDVVSETAFSAIQLAEQGGAEILLREWKKGVAEYRTVFITRRDSGIATLADLRGRKIGFEDPGSTTGFLLPLAILRSAELSAAEVPPTAKASDPDLVAYSFAVEEINIATWVERGIVDAGAISDQDWDDFLRTPAAVKNDLVIFHTSEPLLRSVILAGPGLDAAAKQRLKAVLTRMHEDAAGQEVLKTYNKVAKYDEITGTGAESLDRARRFFPLVAAEIH